MRNAVQVQNITSLGRGRRAEEATGSPTSATDSDGQSISPFASTSACDADSHLALTSPVAREELAEQSGSLQLSRYKVSPRSAFLSMVSRLVGAILDSFAAHSEVAYPGSSEPNDSSGCHEPKQNRKPQWSAAPGHGGKQARQYEPMPSSFVGQQSPEASSLPLNWSTRVSLALTKIGSRMQRKRDARLETLDDWILKDIGIHRCQIRGADRYRDRYNS
jgi:uncharacterized protein YjiS (DUF1127 family)